MPTNSPSVDVDFIPNGFFGAINVMGSRIQSRNFGLVPLSGRATSLYAYFGSTVFGVLTISNYTNTRPSAPGSESHVGIGFYGDAMTHMCGFNFVTGRINIHHVVNTSYYPVVFYNESLPPFTPGIQVGCYIGYERSGVQYEAYIRQNGTWVQYLSYFSGPLDAVTYGPLYRLGVFLSDNITVTNLCGVPRILHGVFSDTRKIQNLVLDSELTNPNLSIVTSTYSINYSSCVDDSTCIKLMGSLPVGSRTIKINITFDLRGGIMYDFWQLSAIHHDFVVLR